MWVAIVGAVLFLLVGYALVFGAIAARFGSTDDDSDFREVRE